MKLALLFALVAAAAVLSHSSPVMPNADTKNVADVMLSQTSGTANDDGANEMMLTGLLASLATKSTKDVQLAMTSENVYGSVNIIKVVGPTSQSGSGSVQSNPSPVTGNPVPDSGAAHLVQPGTSGYGLHDHDRNGRVPNPNKAFLTYTFASPVKVTKAVIVQHGNGVDELELFSGSTSCGTSKGKARSNGQVTNPGVSLQEHVLYDYTFSTNCPPSTEFKLQIRTITCTCGYMIYRMYPLAERAVVRTDVGDRHEEIHGNNGILDLIDKMLAKVVSTTSTAAARKTEAEQAAAKEKTEYEAKKTAETVATDEYIAQNNQAEKEKKMIGEIRAMVIRLNKGKFHPQSCKDLKASDPSAQSGVYTLTHKDTDFKAYCDMSTAGGGWTLVMRTHKEDNFNYEASFWTTPKTLNPAELNNGNHGAPEFKGDGFNSILASEILIKSATTGRHSQLGMSKVSNLRDLFAGPTTRLNVVSGDAKPQQLMSGGSNGACGVAWRTNSGGGTHGKHKVRIGGYFTAAWGCNYGADSNGDPTAAEQAGVGLWDMHWSPFRLTGRSAGVRQAHNYNNCQGGGQVTTPTTIWVR